jgi:hypothetical protein
VNSVIIPEPEKWKEPNTSIKKKKTWSNLIPASTGKNQKNFPTGNSLHIRPSSTLNPHQVLHLSDHIR